MNTEKTETIMSGSSKNCNPEPRAAAAKPKKLQVELSGALHEIVKKILECTALKSQRDVVYNALSVFNWAVEQRRLGRNIGAYFADKSKGLVDIWPLTFPALDEIDDGCRGEILPLKPPIEIKTPTT